MDTSVPVISGEELAAVHSHLDNWTKLFNSNSSNLKTLTLLNWFSWTKPMQLTLTTTGIDSLINPLLLEPTTPKDRAIRRLIDTRVISLIRGYINAEVQRRVDEKGLFSSTLHFWTVLSECFINQPILRRIGHFEQAIGMVFLPNRDDNHLILDRIMQEAEITFMGRPFTERDLAAIGAIRALKEHFGDDHNTFVRRGIYDIDEIRAHIIAIDNQTRLSREAVARQRGTRFIHRPPRANPAIEDNALAAVETTTRPCCHCGDDRHAGPGCHRKHGFPDEILARIKSERHTTGGRSTLR